MLCVTLCNVLSEIVKNGRADLFSNAMIVTLPDISTAVWIKPHRLSIFMGRIGVMETIFPHCQQSFQHKCSAINEVMLTLSRFPSPVPASAGRAHVSAAAAHFCPGGGQSHKGWNACRKAAARLHNIVNCAVFMLISLLAMWKSGFHNADFTRESGQPVQFYPYRCRNVRFCNKYCI